MGGGQESHRGGHKEALGVLRRAPGWLLLSTPSPQDGCGTNDSRPTFKILTENVVCGKLGVTCSRAIRVSLGVSRWGGCPHLAASVTLATRNGQQHLSKLNGHGGWRVGSSPRSLTQPSGQYP